MKLDNVTCIIHLDIKELFEENNKLNKLIYIPHGYTLHFLINAGSFFLNQQPILYSNYHSTLPFERDKYYPYIGNTYNGIDDWIIDIGKIDKPGFFQYYLEYGIKERIKSNIKTFNVEPILKINQKILYPESIAMQTVLSKCLGEYDSWLNIMKDASNAGYNMIHFTPIQTPGQSGSCYSLFDQLSISPQFFMKHQHLSNEDRYQEIAKIIKKMETDYNLLSLSDIVWNHTANNSEWLIEHPECAYNLQNSPHLKVAFELDEGLQKLSNNIIQGKYFNIKQEIETDDDVKSILTIFQKEIWPSLKLWQYFVINAEKAVEEFREAIYNNIPFTPKYGLNPLDDPNIDRLKILSEEGIYNTGDGERFSNKIKLEVVLSLYNTPPAFIISSTEEVERRCELYRNDINKINLPRYQKLDNDFNIILQNLFWRCKRGKITKDQSIFEPYFTKIIDSKGQFQALANNGFIWGGNPLINFASSQSNSYFLREIIPWADTIKLRYGNKPEDNPWLWNHMKKYTEFVATLFHGLRIDNCHSTPINVAQFMLDAARKIRSDLYVIAELFTGSPEIDAHYVANLGINALIREAMAAHDSWDLGRYIYRFSSGKPVASVYSDKIKPFHWLSPSLPYSILMDCTHDNQTPYQKRTAMDTLPNSALVCMAVCATGSTRGYDQLVPYTLDVVKEKRLYLKPTTDTKDETLQSKEVGIIPIKKILNQLHTQMFDEGYNEIHINQVDNIITIQRHNPNTHDAIFMIAHTAFDKCNIDCILHSSSSSIKIPGKVIQKILVAKLLVPEQEFISNEEIINGLHSELIWIQGDEENKKEKWDEFCTFTEIIDNGTSITQVNLKNFPPGSILCLKANLFPEQHQAWDLLQKHLKNKTYLQSEIGSLTNLHLNILLYRCEPEEIATSGLEHYIIPRYGKMTYYGLAGLNNLLRIIRNTNDMGHPLFDNLRDGNWLMDYIELRLSKYPDLIGIKTWLTIGFDFIKKLPRYLIPKYFDIIIGMLYAAAIKHSLKLMSFQSNFIQLLYIKLPSGHKTTTKKFIKKLALGSVQMYGYVPNAPLLYTHSFPCPSLAAGLPFFSVGYMRSWGRDTFISLKGLLLVCGRYIEAKHLILGFSSCIRHGLIPNLLDGGNNPRYNSRDSVWWYLQAIQDYCNLVPNGISILNEEVEILFPTDNQLEYETMKKSFQNPNFKKKSFLYDIIQDIMQKHAQGIHFREWNAGPAIDSKMRNAGFMIDIIFDKKTGFISGGNRWNCGTWMDKMGESIKAKNFGIPATPRDGANIEIIGLLKSTVRWLSGLFQEKKFPYKGVNIVTTNSINRSLIEYELTYQEWDDLIQKSFEINFWIPLDSNDDEQHNCVTSFVHRRGIYKDIVGSTDIFTDYQLRPNMCIAMAVAPEMFEKEHAIHALSIIEKELLGPLGIKTLDPKDWAYRPNYDMSIDDENNYHVSKGFNYHQGPEWIWCLGYFLRAKINFHQKEEIKKMELFHFISSIFLNHKKLIDDSLWDGLPELTNENGKECIYSCPTQAWSMATLLDALYELYQYSFIT